MNIHEAVVVANRCTCLL